MGGGGGKTEKVHLNVMILNFYHDGIKIMPIRMC
jgi:hypothetical protein